MIELITSIAIAYLLGSIPFGLIVTKIFSKKDIRSEGSGNIGATNVVRVSGKKIGYSVFFLDFIKGIIALIIAQHLFNISDKFYSIIAFSSICGHIFPIWLKGKGGKGVATLIGTILFLDPVLLVFLGLGWYIIYYITHIVSIASIITMFALSIFYLIKFKLSYLGLVLAGVLVIYKHKENIKRILSGEENSFKSK